MPVSIDRRGWLLVSWLLTALPLAALEPPGQADAEVAGQVQPLLAKWDRPDNPGCTVAVVRRGEIVYSRGFGSANLESQSPNSPQTVFETASFSKTLTCACVALLLDEGRLSPEDELRTFVPEMHAFDPPIRIQDLVRCRSGIWDQVSVPILIGWENAPQQTPHKAADFLSLLAGQRTLPFRPGTEFRYSSGDYFLLATIVQRITGKTLAAFGRERIFEPLGMTRTFVDEDPTRIIPQRAVGHWKPEPGAWRLWRPTANWHGGGGVCTCVEDLCRWDREFSERRLPRGKHLDELLSEGTLLGNRYVLDLDAYRKETDAEARRESPPGQYRGLARHQFTGGAWGFTTAMSRFPEQQLTVICLSNSDEIAAWTINRQIADVLLAGQLAPVSLARPASELPAVDLEPALLRDIAGDYRLRGTGTLWKIAVAGGAVSLTDQRQTTCKLRPIGPDRLDPEGPQFYATTQFMFTRPAPDKPPAFISRWDEPDQRGQLHFDRVELVQPTPADLAAYAGEYVSNELAATYRFEVREGALWLRVNSRRWEPLSPTVRDEFIPEVRAPTEGRVFRFVRNDRDEVTGLTADYYRVSGVRFQKR